MCVCAKLCQLCLAFCNPVDCSLPDSSVHGILKARILEWFAIPQGIFLTQSLNSGLLLCKQILNHLSQFCLLTVFGKIEK